jgi:hypothetical protein
LVSSAQNGCPCRSSSSTAISQRPTISPWTRLYLTCWVYSPVRRLSRMLTYGPVEIERWKPEQSAASAYLRRGQIIIHGDCITTIGQFACEPIAVIPATASDEQVGTALLEVLAAAKIATPPADFQAERKKILAAAGVKSWARLNDGAVYCFVSETPEHIRIGPSTYERGAFLGLKAADIRLARPFAAVDVGRGLREGFSKCI